MADRYIDARPILAKDESPLDVVLAEAKRVAAGEALIVDAPFDPVPLRERMAALGFRAQIDQRNEGHWRIRFVKKPGQPRTPTGFLGGAKGRLLPASIPFRFFTTAMVFHVAAWIAVIFAAEDLPGFTGGLGWPLAAVHLLTLGVLVMTALGASLQLIPVATRRSIGAAWPPSLIYWLEAIGIPVFCAAAVLHEPAGLAIGGTLAGAGLMIYCGVVAANLRRAGDLPVVSAHVWGALALLVLLVLAGLASAFDYVAAFLPNHGAMAQTHVIAAGGGFMGLLIVGFSHVLIPMFALSRPVADRRAWGVLGLAGLALVSSLAGALAAATPVLAAGMALAALAACVHTYSMEAVFRLRMRKRLGLSFVILRMGGGMLPISLLFGLAVVLGLPVPNGPTLFVLLLLVGWQLTLLVAVLQRIMPFLGSMHVPVKAGAPSLVSRFTDTVPLKLWAGCHGTAVIGLCFGVVTETTSAVQVAGGIGVVGSLCLLTFTGQIVAAVFARKAD